MEKCQDLFNKFIEKINNCNNFEKYYEFLKLSNYNYLFCKYYLKDKNIEYSYCDFFKKVETLTTYFRKELSEYPECSWVGIKLSNNPYYLATFFALLRNNFNVILLDNNGSNDYFNYVIENSGLVAIITEEQFKSNVVKFVNFREAISSKLKLTTKPRSFSNKLALCTSGTTGYFNIIVYDGKQVMHQIRSVLSMLKKAPIKNTEINHNNFLVFPPLHHIFGIIMLLTYSFIGVTNVMCANFTLSSFINATKNGNVEWVATVPLIFEALIKLIKGKSKEGKDPIGLKDILGENLKFCICGGAHTSPEIIKEFNKSQIIFSECYGMTEAGMITINIGTQQERENGSVGKIDETSCEIKVLRSDKEISAEGIGELIVAGSGLYNATLKDGVEIPKKSDINDRFIKTGDLVEIKNGNIYFRDRIKDVIINSNGENICPGELEKNFDFLLDYKVSFTILGLNDFPVLVIYLNNFEIQKDVKGELTKKVVKANQKLPLNKKIVSIYFTSKPFPITSALKVRKFQLKKLIEQNSKDYIKIDLIKRTKKAFSVEEIKEDLSNFFSLYLNLDRSKINDGSLLIEELNVDSLIIAELFIYIEEKYNISIENEFMLEDSLSIISVSNMIFEKI